LSVSSIVLGSLVAGCSGGGPAPPDDNADTQELLPEPPDNWEIVEEQQQLALESEGGYAADYRSPDGGDYRVEIFRYRSADEALDSRKYSAEEEVFLTQDNFGFSAQGPDLDQVILLLGNSPTLTEEYIRENNMNE
jgi:hypothetical protein